MTTILLGNPQPLSPDYVLENYYDVLNPDDRYDIHKYDSIYYYGPCHLAYRYKLINKCGQGSYGKVYIAIDMKTGDTCVIKISKQQYNHIALDEIRMLEHIRLNDIGNSNLVKIVESFNFRNNICIVFEKYERTLYQQLCRNLLNIPNIKKIAYELLTGLVFLNNLNIVHGDLKLENIMVNNQGQMVIIDFGCSFKEAIIKTYIQSRYYRAPEIPIGLSCGKEIDMWSLGCILFELYTRQPLFKAKNEFELIQLIINLIGMPPDHILRSSTRLHKFFTYSLINNKYMFKGTSKVSGHSNGYTKSIKSEEIRLFSDLFKDVLPRS